VETERETWDAIEVTEDFAIGYRVKSHAVAFALVMVTGHSASAPGVYDVPMYEEACDSPAVEHTEDFTKALPFASGSVKWDGCSNWAFGEPDCMTHICGVSDLAKHIAGMRAVYELAARVLPTWDAEVAG
jgi:hypothetical protein